LSTGTGQFGDGDAAAPRAATGRLVRRDSNPRKPARWHDRRLWCTLHAKRIRDRSMSEQGSSRRTTRLQLSQRIAEAILDYVGEAPPSSEHPAARPDYRARAIARKATRSAAMTASTLSLPPGLLGWLTLLPELSSLWKLQTQMVADVAACYGKSAGLRREEMLYCLFRHTDAQAVENLVARVGKRVVVQHASRPEINSIALKIALHISQRVLGRGVSRWIPVVGAVGAGAYAYYDTAQVAKTAIELFTDICDVESETVMESDTPATKTTSGVHRRRP